MKLNKLKTIWLLLPGLLLPFQATQAQSPDDADPEEVFELSPFSVEGSQDIGYLATSSMAGSRLNTNLRDVGSSIQVVTQEFMRDIGATSLDTLLQYTTSTETAGMQGNFTGFSQSGTDPNVGTVAARVSPTHRVRGIGAPDRTRDFFQTLVNFDNYNFERVDINRGANSFLFGLGSPAGLVNANLKKALFRDMSEISFRIGSPGHSPSVRSTFDFNRVLRDDLLAVRIAGLYDDKKHYQRPTYARDKRLYGTFTLTPFSNTTVQGHFEVMDYQGAPPAPVLPAHSLDMFLDPPDPELARLSVSVIEDHRGDNILSTPPFNEGDKLDRLGPLHQSLSFVWDNQVGVSNNEPSMALGTALGTRGGPPRFPDPTDPDGFWGGGRPWLNTVRHGNFYEFKGVGWLDQGFVDLDTFPFHRYNLAGDGDSIEREFKNYNLSVQQLLFNGRGGFEVAFDRQEYEAENYIVFQARMEEIWFDINETFLIPDPDGDGMTPMANPNYGRPAVTTQNNSPLVTEEQDSVRFTGFYRHDFRDHVDGFLGTLLGRHRLTALFDRVDTDFQRSVRRYASFLPDGTPADINSQQNFTPNQFARQMFQIMYIGPQQLDAFTDPNFTLADFQFNPTTTTLARKERSRPVTFWNVEEQRFDETEVSARWVPNRGQELSSSTLDSYAFNTQSHLLNDHIVVNLGWREDEISQRLRVNDAPIIDGVTNVDPENFNLDDTVPEVQKRSTFGYGFVANLPRNLIPVPDWFDMAIHYNKSENFVPEAGLQDMYGDPLPPPTGESEDYGFSMFLFDGKVVARVNRFVGRQANNNAGLWGNVSSNVTTLLRSHGILTNHIMEMDPEGNREITQEALDESNIPRSNELLERAYDARDWLEANIDPRILEVFATEFDEDGRFLGVEWAGSQTTDLQDITARGTEFELTANPMPNWRISLNIARYETTLDNIGPRLAAFIDEVSIPYIEQFGDLDFGQATRTDVQNSIRQEVNEDVFEFFASKASEGMATPEQRKWSGSFVTNYAFRSGPLQGFAVGGAVRWQDRYAYGYPLDEIGGIVVPDVQNPYMSPTQTNVDLFFRYRTNIMNNRVTMITQLNIKNVNNWNSDNVSVIRVQPDGSPARARIDPPREIFLTTTFQF